MKLYRFYDADDLEDTSTIPDAEWQLVCTNRPRDYPHAQLMKKDNPFLTTERLADCWMSELEVANYHSQMDIPENFINVLTQVGCTPAQIRDALYEILTAQNAWIS